ncbi:MAG: hypothetical protein ACYDHF_05930 [Candidatus Cryosericum sp.]
MMQGRKGGVTANGILLSLLGIVCLMVVVAIVAQVGDNARSTLRKIIVASSSSTIHVGETVQFTATGKDGYGSLTDIGGSVVWSDNAPGGLLTPTSAGDLTVTATSGPVFGSESVHVIAPTAIAIMPNPLNVNLGETRQLTVTGTYEDSSVVDIPMSLVTWSKNAPNGLVSGATAGKSSVTAQLGPLTCTERVHVMTPVKIIITPNPASIGIGETQELRATGTYADGGIVDIPTFVTWSNNAPHGLFKGSWTGSFRVTAALGGVSGSTTIHVQRKSGATSSPTPSSSTTTASDYKRWLQSTVEEELGAMTNFDVAKVESIKFVDGDASKPSISIMADDTLGHNMIRLGMLNEAARVLEAVFADSRASRVTVNVLRPMDDAYGDNVAHVAMMIEMSRQTASRMTWDISAARRLPDAADYFYEMPDW